MIKHEIAELLARNHVQTQGCYIWAVLAGAERTQTERLNLFGSHAFNWMKMLAVTEREQLPVDKARDGDPDAWDALFRRYQLPLYTYVFELMRDEQASLDIVQEAFVSATRHLGSLREETKFGSWLFGIAHQKMAQVWRKAGRQRKSLQEFVEAPGETEEAPDEILIRREDEALVSKALDLLPPEQRSVLLLRFIEEFSLEEIAAITTVPPGTVKSRLHYAKKALRGILEGNR